MVNWRPDRELAPASAAPPCERSSSAPLPDSRTPAYRGWARLQAADLIRRQHFRGRARRDPEWTGELPSVARPRESGSRARPCEMEISQCMVKFAVEARDVLVIGLGTDSESAEDPVDGFPQRPRAGKEPGRGQRLPSDLLGERARLRRRQGAALACPLDKIPVSIEPLDR